MAMLIAFPIAVFLLGMAAAFLGWFLSHLFGWILALCALVGGFIYAADRVGSAIPSIAVGLLVLWWLVRRMRRYAAQKQAEERLS